MLQSLVDKHYAEGDVARKPLHYLRTYESLFSSIRVRPLRILELGVHRGASMHVWREYFPESTLVGLDIGEKPEKFPAGPRIHHVQGSQSDRSSLAKAAAFGPFDIIIDDAAHMGVHAKASFQFLYGSHLKPGGLYVLEDWGVSLTNPKWPDAHPYERPADEGDAFHSSPFGMVGMVKQLVDDMLLRHQEIALMHIKPGLVVLEKASVQNSALSLTRVMANPLP